MILSEAHRNHQARASGRCFGEEISHAAIKRTRRCRHPKFETTFSWRDSDSYTNKSYKGTARAQAVLAYCALVGASAVARAISDEQLSREILKTVARLLKNPAS